MSVYRPKGSPFYHFDFQHRGVRFHGSTGCTSRREAERYEDGQRQTAKEALREQSAAKSGPMTVNAAMGRFWDEVGQSYRGTYRETVDTALEWLVGNLGPRTLIRTIGTPQVADLIRKRRAEPKRRGNQPGSDGTVSNATVNRTVTELLRRVLHRAKRLWGQEVQEIDWRALLLPEPRERVRELRDSEEAALFAQMRTDYHPILRFALLTGCRLAECVGLRWRHLDWGNRTITIIGKGGKVATLPLTSGLRALLWPLQGDHPDAVFTYISARATAAGRRGERRPITYEGLKTQWRRCKAAGEIEDFRFHDNRHTAATRLLRETGNLKLVQRLLRHEDIATTVKYAHASDEDLRQAMEAVAERRAARQESAEHPPLKRNTR
ncbi:MAG: site-specific integrase [Pseudomonadota bacterium]